MNKINIGIIGFGVVGRAFLEQVLQIEGVVVKYVVAKNPGKERRLPEGIELYFETEQLLNDPEVEVVVEAIDDADAAFIYAIRTFQSGKTLITANKKMVAEHLKELNEARIKGAGVLYFEASVAGAVPILGTLNDHFRHEPIQSIRGIVNGSCNYILTSMGERGLNFHEALREAQELGYAESDPTLDVEGFDSLYKTIILTYQAFGDVLSLDEILRVGITEITLEDIRAADKHEKKFKLIAEVKKIEGELCASVIPQQLSTDNPLYHIDGVLNAIVISGLHCQNITLSGPGAGGAATASAMIGDLGRVLKSARIVVSGKLEEQM